MSLLLTVGICLWCNYYTEHTTLAYCTASLAYWFPRGLTTISLCFTQFRVQIKNRKMHPATLTAISLWVYEGVGTTAAPLNMVQIQKHRKLASPQWSVRHLSAGLFAILQGVGYHSTLQLHHPLHMVQILYKNTGGFPPAIWPPSLQGLMYFREQIQHANCTIHCGAREGEAMRYPHQPPSLLHT